MDRVLDCQFRRRFGVEVELNTLNGAVKKLDEDKGEIPFGSPYVANLISSTLRKPVEIQGWDFNHNNNNWIVKPDSSCGIEVCTPVLKGWTGLKSLMQVVQAFSKSEAKADKRCSLHAHINISELSKKQVATVVAYYIKCEHVIFDAMPSWRKINRYCQFLGMTDLFSTNFGMDFDELIGKISSVKYYSLNAYHFIKGGGFTWRHNRKPTLEFRIAENEACLDPMYVKCWIRFLLHFVDVTKDLPYPGPYRNSDPWTGLLWLGPRDVFKVLKFDQSLSDGMKQVKYWFIDRVLRYGYDQEDVPMIFSNKVRALVRDEFLDMIKPVVSYEEYLSPSEDALFGKRFTI
jgi:hypothetical protein